ncbi:hypothetical protein ABPG74_002163 [Tetrahymena malaccensis]
MNFTSPLKSSKANNLFESPSCYMSPSAFDKNGDQNTNTLNVINAPFCNSIQQNKSPQNSQFKTPTKYSDRFIPARTDSISKTLFDLKDEMIVEEQPQNRMLTESPFIFQGSRQSHANNSNSQSTTISGFSNGHTLNTFQQLTTPSKKVNFLSQQDENTKSYNELIQRELFGNYEGSNNKKSSEELQKTPILKFHWDQKNATTSPLLNIQQSPFQIFTPDDRSKEQKRKISKAPFKVLDAPGLQDDFYVDLLDWSSQNQIAVGLGKSIFIWEAASGKVQKLCDSDSDASNNRLNENYQNQSQSSYYTSLKWSPNGNQIAIGNDNGQVGLWDLTKKQLIREFSVQKERIGCIDFNNNNVFAAGSKDKSILIQDIRDPSILRIAKGHKQEICQVKWSPDQQYLASGGNDNMVAIWDIARSYQNINGFGQNEISPYQKHNEHQAAVRALAWNPHQYGVLLSGGGSRDQTIKVWNINTNSLLGSVEVGSQVCKLLFSPDQNEFVCAHGFEYNKVTVWKYPTMTQIAELEGHQSRVLFMSMAPDNQTIVTGAGDETLKFWKIFQGRPVSKQQSLLKHSDLR